MVIADITILLVADVLCRYPVQLGSAACFAVSIFQLNSMVS
jgi:TctA family transporter